MTRRRLRRAQVALFVAIALNASALVPVSAQSVTLKPRFVSGSTAYIEFTHEIDQTLTGGSLGEERVRTQIEQTFGLRRTVEIADEDHARVVLTFERIRQKIESARWPLMSYDSDRPNEGDSSELLAQLFRPMLRAPLVVEFADGRVRSFRGMDEIGAKVREAAGENVLYNRMQMLLSDEMGRFLWAEPLIAAFPGRAVCVGDTWSRELTQAESLAGPLTLEYRFRLERVGESDGRQVATLAVSGVIRPAAGATQPADCTVCYTLEHGELTGQTTIDVAAGELIAQTENLNVVLSMSVPNAGGGDPDRMRLTQSIRYALAVRSQTDRESDKAAPAELLRP